MQLSAKWLYCTLPLVFTACGGGGSDRPPVRPASTISGVVFDGPLVGADINVFDFQDGVKGDRISTANSAVGTTISGGRYSVDIVHPDGYILIEAEGGTYNDEMSGEDVVNGGAGLRAVVYYESGEDQTVHLTPYTTWASCLMEHYVDGETGPGFTVDEAVLGANTAMQDYLDLSADPDAIYNTAPAEVTAQQNGQDRQTNVLYGYLTAGLSGLASIYADESGAPRGRGSFTALNITTLGCSDLRADGGFDGIGETSPTNASGQLTLGSGPNRVLDANFYRAGVAQGILRFAADENNIAGLRPDQLFAISSGIADHEGDIFDGSQRPIDPAPIDIVAPTIRPVLEPINDQPPVLAQIGDIPYRIQDNLAIGRVDLYVDFDEDPTQEPLSYFPGDTNFSTDPILLDYDFTELFEDDVTPEDRVHSVRVVAFDVVQAASADSSGLPAPAETEQDYIFVAENTPVLTSPTLTNTQGGFYTASGVFVNGSQVTSEELYYSVNGGNFLLAEEGLDTDSSTWTIPNIPLADDEEHTLIFGILDSDSTISDLNTTTAVIRVDNRVPSNNSIEQDVFIFNADENICDLQSQEFGVGFNQDDQICINNEFSILPINPSENTFSFLQSEGYLLIQIAVRDLGGSVSIGSELSDLEVFGEHRVCDEATSNCGPDAEYPSAATPFIRELRSEVSNPDLGEEGRFLPITQDALQPGTIDQPNLVHEYLITVRDEAGNVNQASYRFKIAFYPNNDAPGVPSRTPVTP